MDEKQTNDNIKDTVDRYEKYDSSPEKKKKKTKKEIFSYLRIIIIAVGAAIVLVTCIIINAKVPSGSMEDTIHEGDRLIGLRVAYLFSSPQRGDIVIFKYPDDESKKFIKRVIGLPGDTVSFTDGDVYVNGEKLDEPYLKEQHITFSPNETSYTVPNGCYFMLGDNRGNSKDSRYWAEPFVQKNKILAKALFRYYGTYETTDKEGNTVLKQGINFAGLK